jgi:hypothetical protein
VALRVAPCPDTGNHETTNKRMEKSGTIMKRRGVDPEGRHAADDSMGAVKRTDPHHHTPPSRPQPLPSWRCVRSANPHQPHLNQEQQYPAVNRRPCRWIGGASAIAPASETEKSRRK